MTAREIRRLRKGAHLTQAALAERMGLGVAGNITISRWESGGRPVTEPHARLLRLVCLQAKAEQNEA